VPLSFSPMFFASMCSCKSPGVRFPLLFIVRTLLCADDVHKSAEGTTYYVARPVLCGEDLRSFVECRSQYCFLNVHALFAPGVCSISCTLSFNFVCMLFADDAKPRDSFCDLSSVAKIFDISSSVAHGSVLLMENGELRLLKQRTRKVMVCVFFLASFTLCSFFVLLKRDVARVQTGHDSVYVFNVGTIY